MRFVAGRKAFYITHMQTKKWYEAWLDGHAPERRKNGSDYEKRHLEAYNLHAPPNQVSSGRGLAETVRQRQCGSRNALDVNCIMAIGDDEGRAQRNIGALICEL